MLTQEDVVVIGQIVENGIKTHVPPIVKAEVTGAIDELEGRLNVMFTAVQESLDNIENQMVTKDYLDKKLAGYVKKPGLAF